MLDDEKEKGEIGEENQQENLEKMRQIEELTGAVEKIELALEELKQRGLNCKKERQEDKG